MCIRDREAHHIVEEIQRKYDRFKQDPTVVIDPEGGREHCGMNVVDVGKPVLPTPKGMGLDIQWSWNGARDRLEWLKSGLTTALDAKRRWVGPLAPNGRVVLTVTKTSGMGENMLSLELRRRGSDGNELLHSVSVVVHENEVCANEPAVKDVQGRWEVAGAVAADHIVDYFRSIQIDVPVTNTATSRYLLPGAEWWTDKRPAKVAGGIAWSVGDLALAGGGVLLLGLSINERNNYAQGSGSLAHANDMEYVGFGLLGAFVAERIIWGLVGSE